MPIERALRRRRVPCLGRERSTSQWGANGGGNFAGTDENGQHVSAGQAQQQTAQT